jgi:glycosyltransferase involved in cell wall biosynthesis
MISVPMKILIATGIFPPDIGGPAVHTKKLAEEFVLMGWGARVVTYTSGVEDHELPFTVKRIPRTFPKIVRVLLYFLNTLIEARSADVIYAHDPTSAGFPASLSARLLKKKFVIRIGGDAIWEKSTGKGRRFLSLKEYYEKKLHLKDYPSLFKLIRKILKRADAVIVPARILKDLYQTHYGLPEGKIFVIENPVPKMEFGTIEKDSKNIVLFAGRFVAYKNLSFLIDSFVAVRKKIKKGELHLIGQGPELSIIKNKIKSLGASSWIKVFPAVSQTELISKIKEATIGVCPALTEFNPNFILECLALGKPILLSRENGLTVRVPEEFLFDPKNSQEFEEKLEKLLRDSNYEVVIKKVKELKLKKTWRNVIDDHVAIFNSLINPES